jgi:L1 cell adhesion molecule like protein
MTTIIPRNSSLPAKGEDCFSTWRDNQEKVNIQVYEGERRCTKDNHLLGTFELKGISKKPRGVPKIKIMFEVDLNGILTATAIDEESGKDKKLIVEKSTSLTSEQIKNMLEETEKFKEIDKKNKEYDDAYFTFANSLEHSKNIITDPNIITKIPVEYFEKIRNVTENVDYKEMRNNKKKYKVEDFNRASSEINEILDSFLLVMKGIIKNDVAKTRIEEVD